MFLTVPVTPQVGYFGYVAFCDEEVSGDILMNFRSTIFSEAVKLGFVLSIAVSFPLAIFPCRTSLHTLLCARVSQVWAHEYIRDYFFGCWVLFTWCMDGSHSVGMGMLFIRMLNVFHKYGMVRMLFIVKVTLLRCTPIPPK